MGRGWAVVLSALVGAAPGACGGDPAVGGANSPASGSRADASEPDGSGRRVALVVGNDDYEGVSRLENAVNDARAVSAALEDVGFAVERVENATQEALQRALAAFAGSLRGDDVALFYFAGHGMEVDSVNYLIPTDFDAENAAGVRFDAVSAIDVQEVLQRARVAMLVFDACRNNPYRGFRTAGGGLAPMEARGTLIAYAAGAGELAADAAPGADNGLFTSKFVEALGEADVTASDLFRRVRREVFAASNEEQWPAVYDDLLADFVFRPSAVGGEGTPALAASGSADPATGVGGAASAALEQAALQAETALWQSVQSRPTVAMYEAYLAQYPNGTFAAVARLAASALRADPPPASRPTGAVGPPSRPAAAPDPRPSRRSAGERFSDCAECPELVVVPAGTFTMGSPSSEAVWFDEEGSQHRVTIPSPLAVGVYEVTFAEWDACVSAGGCGGYRPDDEGWGRGARPVVNVNWNDAQSYVRWLSSRTGASYRLLSESEWEYVARAGTRTRYWWGDSVGRNRANCDGCGSRWDNEQTAPVGSFRSNAFGLHDVSGNVWEWVEDCSHRSYAGAPSDGSAWTSGGDCSLRVLRGGSWFNYPGLLRSAHRDWDRAGRRVSYVGFRVSRTLD